jgi:hypothetical protein
VLGVLLGVNYLRGVRKPVMIGFHLILGIGGLEQFAEVLGGAPNGVALAAGTYGNAAALVFVASIFTGLGAALLARYSRRRAEMVLISHVGIGAAGFVLLLLWAAQLA